MCKHFTASSPARFTWHHCLLGPLLQFCHLEALLVPSNPHKLHSISSPHGSLVFLLPLHPLSHFSWLFQPSLGDSRNYQQRTLFETVNPRMVQTYYSQNIIQVTSLCSSYSDNNSFLHCFHTLL